MSDETVIEEPAVDEPERPDWLKPNFESVEAQAKAYNEALPAMTKAQQERAELQRQLEAFGDERPSWLPDRYETIDAFVEASREAEVALKRTQQELFDLRQTLAEPDYDDGLDEHEMLVAQRPVLAAADLQAAMALKMSQVAPTPVTGEQALLAAEQLMANAVPGWEQVRERVAQEVAQRPFLQPAIPSVEAWAGALEAGLKLVYAADAQQQSQRSLELTAEKLNAQTMSGAGVRQPSPSSKEQWAAEIAAANETLGGL